MFHDIEEDWSGETFHSVMGGACAVQIVGRFLQGDEFEDDGADAPDIGPSAKLGALAMGFYVAEVLVSCFGCGEVPHFLLLSGVFFVEVCLFLYAARENLITTGVIG